MQSDKVFAGSVPAIYDSLLVPLIFEPYARDLAAIVARAQPVDILETAAGTGALTRELAARLPAARIVATDLNDPMIAQGRAWPVSGSVTWRQADAQALPFGDGLFDAVACQFGAMFFPDRIGAYREARRVLRPGGLMALAIWGGLDGNDFARAVHLALADLLPDDPPAFFARTPYGHGDPAEVSGDLAQAGFSGVRVEVVQHESRAASARDVAVALCQGTPLRGEIEARGRALDDVTDRVAAVLEDRFGPGAVSAPMHALLATATA
jgi:SAM-dependent methyltransferase